MSQIKGVIDNMKSKATAIAAHIKLTKVNKLCATDQQLQRQSLATTNPRRMIQLAIANAMRKLEAIDKEAVETASAAAAKVVAPRVK